jgi:hypothetical protein
LAGYESYEKYEIPRKIRFALFIKSAAVPFRQLSYQFTFGLEIVQLLKFEANSNGGVVNQISSRKFGRILVIEFSFKKV